MARYTGYCRGCNQEFPALNSDRCPLCGEEMTVAGDRPTVDLDDTVAGHTLGRSHHRRRDLSRELIGTQLSLYTMEEFLGRGGMAWVFLAKHNMLRRSCAVKILCPDLQERQPDSVELFLAEARTAASLIHPHIVTVHNVGEANDFHFIELEYVPGKSLQTMFARKRSLKPIEATGYLLQSCAALAEAHRHGMIHRDFKPANILVRPDGTAKLADFGLAKRVAKPVSDGEQGLTGTPYYMAPELFRGAFGSKSSDVYAVGVSFYYLLTGRFPFTSSNLLKLGRLHATGEIPDPRELTPSIPTSAVETIQTALAKDPADRFPDGEAMHRQLQSVFTGLRSLDSIVSQAIESLEARMQRRDDRLEIIVALNGGRTQTVYVEEAESQPWSTKIVRVYSICGPATSSYYRKALELNAQIPHGSIAIEPISGTPHFVMLASYLRATCDPIAIRHGIQEIAHWADDVEHALTGEDQY